MGFLRALFNSLFLPIFVVLLCYRALYIAPFKHVVVHCFHDNVLFEFAASHQIIDLSTKKTGYLFLVSREIIHFQDQVLLTFKVVGKDEFHDKQ